MIELLTVWGHDLGLSIGFVLLTTRIPPEAWLIGIGVVGGAAVVAALVKGRKSAPSSSAPSSASAPVGAAEFKDWIYPIPRKERRRKPAPERASARAPAGDGETEDVDITVCAPSAVRCTTTVAVQVFIHREEKWQFVADARQRDPDAVLLGSTDLDMPLRRGEEIKVQIDPGTAKCKGSRTVRRVWTGKVEKIAFLLEMPANADTIKPRVDVFAEGIKRGWITFKIEAIALMADMPPQAALEGRAAGIAREAKATRVGRAFLSYAKPDRNYALRAAQVLKGSGIEYFQDVLSLEPGDLWEQTLYERIAQCDLFLLFWSRHAKESEWVIKEVMEALRQRDERRKTGADLAISPIIIEGPPIVPPPDSLQDLHMNDVVQHVVFAEEMAERRTGKPKRAREN